jgi:hypothetical protein
LHSKVKLAILVHPVQPVLDEPVLCLASPQERRRLIDSELIASIDYIFTRFVD